MFHSKRLCIALLVLFGTVTALVHAEEKVAKLEIVKAEYGDLPDGAKTDVTAKVKAMATADGLRVEATNENFGDPIEGTAKKLRVDFTLDGVATSLTVQENETLTVSTKPSKLKIVSAFYGDLPDGAKTDVAAKVRLMVADNALKAEATNDNFGDPADGVTKKLKVEYTFDGGAAKTKEVAENETLTISDKGE